jgi:hypothetical protein
MQEDACSLCARFPLESLIYTAISSILQHQQTCATHSSQEDAQQAVLLCGEHARSISSTAAVAAASTSYNSMFPPVTTHHHHQICFHLSPLLVQSRRFALMPNHVSVAAWLALLPQILKIIS